MALFAGDSFASMIAPPAAPAYRDFRHAAVAPLVQLDERLWLLGAVPRPDPGLQGSGAAARRAAVRRGAGAARRACDDRRRDLRRHRLGGDRAACRDRAALDIFILYPQGRISEVQRRQMTTVDAPNAYALAVEGTFDDCQDIVKALFADPALARAISTCRRSIRSTSPGSRRRSSITSPPALALGAPARAVSFSVPTGNFGNVYAGHLARALGLPIERLVIGTNANDILARYLTSGAMTIASVVPSLSPSMDIQVASNFERLLFELKGRNGAAVAPRCGSSARPARCRPTSRRGAARASCSPAIGSTMRRPSTRSPISTAAPALLIDPHTAVAVAAARAERRPSGAATPMVALATRPPGEISRCGRARHRHPPGAAAGARRHLGKARAYHRFAE